jgi:glycerol kinase
MSRFILALDQGTTSSRAILFNEQGQPTQVAQQEFRQIYPQPGWVEHDPMDIWSTQYAVAQEVLRKAGVKASDIAAIGITNQRETTILWDRKTGAPVFNAIVWQCRRTADFCRQLRDEGFDKVIREKTGLVTDPYFSGTKVHWILENVEGVRTRAEAGELAFGTVDTWLIWKLSGGRLHVTDVSNASRTLLYNIHEQKWDEDILARFNVPASLLPEVKPSSMVYGTTDLALFESVIPIAGIAGDQQAATFGQICLEPGMAKNTYGTGCFIVLNTGERHQSSASGLLTTIAWKLGDSIPTTYALEGSVFIAGAAVQWLRDEMNIIQKAADIEGLANSVQTTDGVYFVPAFTGLGAPHWDSQARGIIVGLTRGSNKAHLARAVLESIAFQTADVIDAMNHDSGLKLDTLRVDGGAAANDLLMQIQADILGVTVERPTVTETTALGAAYLAGLATGFYPSLDELAKRWKLNRAFSPRMSPDQRESMLAGWRKAVERAKDWVE